MRLMKWICMGLLAAAILPGQTAQLTGVVRDASQAVVPGTKVSVVNAATGVARTTVSNEQGNYAVPLLQPGEYRISAQKDGFRPVSREAIRLEVDQTARIDFLLEPGAVTETLTVVEQTPLIESETTALGQVIDETKIANIPINGRSTFRLVQLTPGVLSSPSASGQFGDVPVNTTWDANFAINGGRAQSNEILIDGVPSTAGFFNQMTTIPSVESTLEFKVQSNNLAAEFGRSGGGVLNVSTRSGTNELHGTLFEFLRNSAFDANEFFNNRAGAKKPPFRMNQFGGAVGGPVWLGKLYDGRNRTFFFTDYQGTRWRRGDVFLGTLPTDLERSGDFSQTRNSAGQMIGIFDPTTSRPNPAAAGQFIRDPFAGNRIPSSRIDPIAKNLMPYYPQPNTAGDPVSGANNYISNAVRKIDQNSITVRADHNVSSSYRMYGRFSRNQTILAQPDYFGTVATPGNGSVGTTPFRQHTFALDNTVTLSPTTLLNVRYGFARWYQLRQTRSYGFDQTTLGFPSSLVSQYQIPVFPQINPDGYTGQGGQSYLDNGNDTHSLIGSINKITGRHNIKFGGDGRLRRINFFNLGGGGGIFNFTRAFTQGPDPNRPSPSAGIGMASLLLGVGNGSAPMAAGSSIQNLYMAGYIQDDIRLTSKLTVNLGLRYETETPYTERRNAMVWFDTNVASPVRNPAYPNLTGALRFAGPDTGSRYIFPWDKVNFAPRAGLAYSVLPKTVIRAGAGVFYGPLEVSPNAVGFIPNSGYSSSTPWLGTVDGFTPFRYLSNPFPEGLVQPVRDSLGTSTFLGQGFSVWDSTSRNPYNVQWNFDIQRELPWGVVVDAAYAANRGVAQARGRELNGLDPRYLSLGTGLQQLVDNPFYGKIPVGTLSQQRVQQRQLLLPYPQYLGFSAINNTSGNSIYHSFQLKAQKRFTQGVNFLVSYTAGKLIADMNNQLSPIGDTNNTGIQNPYDLHSERAVSEMDVAQMLSVSYVVELPFGPNKRYLNARNGVLPKLAGGWQINGVVAYNGGLPLAMSAPITGGGNRPNSTGKSASITAERSRGEAIDRWFDTTQFLQPAAFTFGNVGRTLPDVRSPSLRNLDVSLIKNTAISEKVDLQFRAEAFNITNTPYFWLPGTGLNDPNFFGRVRKTQGLPRVMQFALKLIF